MKKKGVILIAAMILTVLNLYAESHIGWTGTFSSSQLIDADNGSNRFEGKMELTPLLRLNWQNLEFTARADFKYLIPEYGIDFTLKEFNISYSEDTFWKLNVGRLYYLPGSSEFFSNTNYFASTDYLQLIENQGEDFYSAGDMIQLILSRESLYFNSTFSFSPVKLSEITSDSPWFPIGSIPSDIYTFGGDSYTRNEINVEEADSIQMSWQDISVGLETGWSTYLFDLSLQYYHGWNNEYLYQMDVELRDDELFDTTLTPFMDRVDSLGVNWLWNINAFYFWLDGSYTFNKTFVDSTLRVPGLTTTSDSAPYLEESIGIRYDFDWQNLTLIAEWKDSYAFSDNKYLIMPYFDSALVGAFTMAIDEYRHQPGGFFLFSLDDKSWLSALQWKYNIREFFSLEGTVAWMQGEETSFFGQYEQDLYIALNLVFRH